jgi:hypothetical protein
MGGPERPWGVDHTHALAPGRLRGLELAWLSRQAWKVSAPAPGADLALEPSQRVRRSNTLLRCSVHHHGRKCLPPGPHQGHTRPGELNS